MAKMVIKTSNDGHTMNQGNSGQKQQHIFRTRGKSGSHVMALRLALSQQILCVSQDLNRLWLNQPDRGMKEFLHGSLLFSPSSMQTLTFLLRTVTISAFFWPKACFRLATAFPMPKDSPAWCYCSSVWCSYVLPIFSQKWITCKKRGSRIQGPVTWHAIMTTNGTQYTSNYATHTKKRGSGILKNLAYFISK